MGNTNRYAPEVRERAVRLVFEHRDEYESEWAAIRSISEKFGCSSETLRNWVRRTETDAGERPGVTSSEQDELKELRWRARNHSFESVAAATGHQTRRCPHLTALMLTGRGCILPWLMGGWFGSLCRYRIQEAVHFCGIVL
jgi:transposase